MGAGHRAWWSSLLILRTTLQRSTLYLERVEPMQILRKLEDSWSFFFSFTSPSNSQDPSTELIRFKRSNGFTFPRFPHQSIHKSEFREPMGWSWVRLPYTGMLSRCVLTHLNGACAHYIMVSKFHWKPFWLATQRDPQNDWTATQTVWTMTYSHRPHWVLCSMDTFATSLSAKLIHDCHGDLSTFLWHGTTTPIRGEGGGVQDGHSYCVQHARGPGLYGWVATIHCHGDRPKQSDYYLQDPLEAILVIFGRRALIFFVWKLLEKYEKSHHLCAHAQWWSPWRGKNVEKGHLAPSNLTVLLRQDPLDLSFWSFLTFFHHRIEKVERHLLWKFHKKNSKTKVVKCATELARLHKASIQSCTQNRPSPKVQSRAREIEFNFFTA